jgi:hypothetical protein
MARGERRSLPVGGCVLRLRRTRSGAADVRLAGDRGSLSPADRERAAWLAWTHTGTFGQDAWYEVLFRDEVAT